MTSLMPRALPCVRCNDRLVKTGGITGMCTACRAEDPAMAETKRQEHAAFKQATAEWLAEVGTWEPKVGAYRIDPAKVFGGARRRRK